MNLRGIHHTLIIAVAIGILAITSVKTFSNDSEKHNAISGNLRRHLINDSNSSSLMTVTPNDFALSSLLPDFSPAIK